MSPTTRYARAQCHEGEGVDRVLEEDEAAQVAGDIADERRDEGNHGNGQYKGPVAPVEPWSGVALFRRCQPLKVVVLEGLVTRGSSVLP